VVPDLVALAIPAGPAYVDALQRIWDTGAAVLPVDLRLPEAAQQRLVESLGANRVVDATGEHTLAAGRPTEAGDALVVATSGTTGTPKGVVITHDALDAAAFATSKGVDADPAADGWLCCLPVAHMGGLGVITRAVRTGTPLVVHDGFDAEAVEAAARAGSTLVSLVPTAMRRIDTSLFRTILVGGSAIPPDRPANSMATYGLTETCGGVIYERQALEGVEVRIADGEIQLRCPMLLRCYRDGVDPRTADGWFPTGDLGSIDADGVLHVDGRAGDLIISGGENVWPAPIEALLATHPGVAAVAVVGRVDPEWGQVVTAIIEPRQAGAVPQLADLQELVRDQLPVWCVPRALEVAELPKTALGKVQRSGL